MSEVERNRKLTAEFLDAKNREGKLVELKEYMDTELVTEVICGGRRGLQRTAE